MSEYAPELKRIVEDGLKHYSYHVSEEALTAIVEKLSSYVVEVAADAVDDGYWIGYDSVNWYGDPL